MLRLYEGEVLGKLPVIQHFVFGYGGAWVYVYVGVCGCVGVCGRGCGSSFVFVIL